jgi:hypothetical protein
MVLRLFGAAGEVPEHFAPGADPGAGITSGLASGFGAIGPAGAWQRAGIGVAAAKTATSSALPSNLQGVDHWPGRSGIRMSISYLIRRYPPALHTAVAAVGIAAGVDPRWISRRTRRCHSMGCKGPILQHQRRNEFGKARAKPEKWIRLARWSIGSLWYSPRAFSYNGSLRRFALLIAEEHECHPDAICRCPSWPTAIRISWKAFRVVRCAFWPSISIRLPVCGAKKWRTPSSSSVRPVWRRARPRWRISTN